jgi:hypothetical protein
MELELIKRSILEIRGKKAIFDIDFNLIFFIIFEKTKSKKA